MSVKENTGIQELKNKIIEMFNLNEIETNDMTYLSNARSIALLNKALSKLEESLIEIEKSTPIDIIEFYLKDSWDYLGEIIGQKYTDELINEIFSRFCLGK